MLRLLDIGLSVAEYNSKSLKANPDSGRLCTVARRERVAGHTERLPTNVP